MKGSRPGTLAAGCAAHEDPHATRPPQAETAGAKDEAPKIAGVPGTIVQGRYDMICPPVSAWTLARHWRGADLRMVPVAGHALSEPGISRELIGVMDGLRE